MTRRGWSPIICVNQRVDPRKSAISRGYEMSTKLLLVTSDLVLAKAYQARLTKEGFDVDACRTGHEGLVRARGQTPHVMLVDLALPGMTGLDVIKWLRDVPWLAQVPVVVLIERTVKREVLEECQLWGIAGVLEKDTCSLAEVVARAQACLRRVAAGSSV